MNGEKKKEMRAKQVYWRQKCMSMQLAHARISMPMQVARFPEITGYYIMRGHAGFSQKLPGHAFQADIYKFRILNA